MIYVIWGPPASGKSTYVAENRSENSVTFDFDKVMQALSGLKPHHKNRNLIGLVVDIRQMVIDALGELEVDDAWIITTWVDEDFQAKFGDVEVEYVLMRTDKETCLQRVYNDPDRAEVAEEMKEVIEEWFDKHGAQNSIAAKGGGKMPKKFWNLQKVSDSAGELSLYGEISSVSWWGDEVTPQMFKDELDALGDISTLNVYINSPGGDVFAGQAIHSILKRHKATVHVYIDGLAASIASVVAMAGDTVTMPRNAMMMIHKPFTVMVGNADDFLKMASDLEKIQDSIEEAYLERTNLDKAELKTLIGNESWLTAEECVEFGLADEIEKEREIAACQKGGILMFNSLEIERERFENPPELRSPPTRQELLNVLKQKSAHIERMIKRWN